MTAVLMLKALMSYIFPGGNSFPGSVTSPPVDKTAINGVLRTLTLDLNPMPLESDLSPKNPALALS